MATAIKNEPIFAERFRQAYPGLKPLLLQEYPEVDAQSLDSYNDDPDKIVDLIAERTKHTKVKVRRDLDELTELARAEEETRLVRALHTLEQRSQELAARFQEEVIPKAEKQMREHLWTSLFSALGLGVVVGLLLGASRMR